MKCILFGLFITSLMGIGAMAAENCPMESGRYGNSIQYQNMICRFMITADKTGPRNNRNLTFNNEGAIQVFSNFPGTTNSNSTGARVYYLFPFKVIKSITAVNENQLTVVHPSGARFKFDKNGKVSSPDLKMKVSEEINSRNDGGVEIESFQNGIVVDLGYRNGNTPVLNKNAVVTITDKNKKKCKMINSDINIIARDDVKLRYKTNEALYGFLSEKCPGLDLSDLLKPMGESLSAIKRPSSLGAAPKLDEDLKPKNTSRKEKDKIDELDNLINTLNKNSNK